MIKHISLLLLFFLLSLYFASAQTYTIKGKVIDAETAEAIPFGNVYPKSNPQKGTTTDFDGYYTLTLEDIKDSIVVSYIGYQKRLKLINPDQKEGAVFILNFQIKSQSQSLDEIVIKAGEDPSYPIMRQVLANKNKNDKRQIANYEYESYTKVEFDIDNVSERFGKRKIIRKVQEAIDSVGGLTGEDGQPLIPLFLSETISKYYYRRDPERVKENVVKSKIEGVGFSEDSPISQIIGSSFQEYNFYKNWMLILDKDFVSPLADGWKLYYDYYMADSSYIGDRFCYKIEVYPKREQDLSFEGVIWIDKATYALKQIDVKVGRKANINFIEKIKIQQELNPTEQGPWIPTKTRVLIDVAELTDKSAGVLLKFYVSNQDISLGKEYPLSFFKEPVEVEPDADRFTPDYWAQKRHDPLSPSELQTYALIDTIKQVPIVKTYSEILTIVSSGYYTLGPIDFGNYIYTYAFNNVEGQRFRLGARTNETFSRKLELKGYLAYGTRDGRLKYSGRIRYIPSRKVWTEMGLERREDIYQVAANPNGVTVPGAYLASLNFFDVESRGPFYQEQNSFYVQTDVVRGFTQKVSLINNRYTQIGDHFAYRTEPEAVESSPLERNFTTTELLFETRLAKGERFFYLGNNRFSLGTKKLPILTFRYTLGLNNFLGGDFEYHKFNLALEQELRLGPLGRTYYNLSAGYTAFILPYPLLEVHLGNSGFFYNFYGFNLMSFLEFVSDQHVALNWEHNFNGLITNYIPLLKKLKWRTFLAANIAYGNLREANRNLIPATNAMGDPIEQPRGFDDRPYVELGYGISNIFKFFQVNFMHRLTYLDNPDIRKFGVFVAARFEL